MVGVGWGQGFKGVLKAAITTAMEPGLGEGEEKGGIGTR